jgi:hypothetical protein
MYRYYVFSQEDTKFANEGNDLKICCATIMIGGLLMSLGVSASASSVTYSFSGKLTDVRESGAGFAFGDSFAATYSHDDADQAGRLIEPGRIGFSGGQLSVDAAGRSFEGTSSSELQVFDDWTNAYGGYFGVDGYFVSSWSHQGAVSYLVQFDLWDFTESTLFSLSVPTQTQVTKLSQNGRIFIREFSNGVETGLAAGYFQQFNPTSVVPEPATYSTLLFGLLLIGAIRSFNPHRKFVPSLKRAR